MRVWRRKWSVLMLWYGVTWWRQYGGEYEGCWWLDELEKRRHGREATFCQRK